MCTSGFGVNHNGTADRGVTTAGHCLNNKTYSGTALTFQSENTNLNHDEQWHTGWQFTIRNWIHDSDYPTPTTREITSKRNWSQQATGAFVCKYGRNGGYACGYIQSKFSGLCGGGGGDHGIYVQHQGTTDLVVSGDSGGPVFLQNTAYGTISCWAGSGGLDMTYVASDYVESGLNVTILTLP